MIMSVEEMSPTRTEGQSQLRTSSHSVMELISLSQSKRKEGDVNRDARYLQGGWMASLRMSQSSPTPTSHKQGDSKWGQTLWANSVIGQYLCNNSFHSLKSAIPSIPPRGLVRFNGARL